MEGTCHSFQNLIYHNRNFKNSVFLISVTWERTCSLYTDRHSNGRTDIMRQIIAFRNYANAINNIESNLKPKISLFTVDF